jgi:hypothetical protein
MQTEVTSRNNLEAKACGMIESHNSFPLISTIGNNTRRQPSSINLDTETSLDIHNYLGSLNGGIRKCFISTFTFGNEVNSEEPLVIAQQPLDP